MGFEALLGNARLKDNLKSALRQGKTSHFYLISGPEGSGKHTLARLIAAAALCTGSDKPCLTCAACRKVLSGNHPDFITVDDPEKKTVPVDLIRRAKADIYVRPNEGDKKIYLFPRAQDMGIPGQNALLKILEEPPSYGVFLLLSDNPEALLPTVRSRCVELNLKALDGPTLKQALRRRFADASQEALEAAARQSGGYLGQAVELLEGEAGEDPRAAAFVDAYAAGDLYALAQVLVPLEKSKRDALIPVLQGWCALVQNALLQRSGGGMPTPAAKKLIGRRRPAELLKAAEALTKAVEYAQGNISPGAICGWLLWELA